MRPRKGWGRAGALGVAGVVLLGVLLSPVAPEDVPVVDCPAWLGIHGVRQADAEPGLLVHAVEPESAAARAGLAAGDRLLGLGDLVAEDPLMWLQASGRLASRAWPLVFEREGERATTRVSLPGVPILKLRDAALQRALAFLMLRQREDGAWNTATPELVDGFVKASPRNTALILMAISALPPELRQAQAAAIARGLEYLERSTSPAGWVGDPTETIRWQNYTTAFTLHAIIKLQADVRPSWRQHLLHYLRSAQLLDRAGAGSFDWYFGAWNYRDQFHPDAVRAELPMTVTILDALVAAGVPPDDVGLAAARDFLQRCQNLPQDGRLPEPVDDGGFFFNPRSSKAGEIVIPGRPVRFRSYGSVTCDGIRGLLLLGVPVGHARIRAAIDWMTPRYTLRGNPGFDAGSLVPYETGIFYYYLWSLARAFADVEAKGPEAPGLPKGWPGELVRWLVFLQGPDGSWVNPEPVMEENDPLVTTPMAMLALMAAGRAQR